MNIACILLAGGNSSRYQFNKQPNCSKLLARFTDHESVFKKSCLALLKSAVDYSEIIIVTHNQWYQEYQNEINTISIDTTVAFVNGGGTRRESVLNALQHLKSNPPQAVLIHDAARPLIQPHVINQLIHDFTEKQLVGASLAHRVTDTIKRTRDETLEIVETLSRDNLWAIETPQIFNYNLLYNAHQNVSTHIEITDDLMLLEYIGIKPIHLIENTTCNLKITTSQDFILANSMLQNPPTVFAM